MDSVYTYVHEEKDLLLKDIDKTVKQMYAAASFWGVCVTLPLVLQFETPVAYHSPLITP